MNGKMIKIMIDRYRETTLKYNTIREFKKAEPEIFSNLKKNDIYFEHATSHMEEAKVRKEEKRKRFYVEKKEREKREKLEEEYRKEKLRLNPFTYWDSTQKKIAEKYNI